MIRNWYNQIPYPALKTIMELNWNPLQLWFFSNKLLGSKKISNDQELIQSDPISSPQNYHRALKSWYDWHNVEKNENCYSKHKSLQAELHVQSLIFFHCFIWINFVSVKYEAMWFVVNVAWGMQYILHDTCRMSDEHWPGSKRSCYTHVRSLQWREASMLVRTIST